MVISAIYLISLIICCISFLLLLRMDASKDQKFALFIGFLTFTFIYSSWSVFHRPHTSFDLLMVCQRLEFFSISGIAVTTFILSFHFFEIRAKNIFYILHSAYGILLAAFSVNFDLGQFFFKRISLINDKKVSIICTEFGPGFYVFIASIIIYTLWTFSLYIYVAITKSKFNRRLALKHAFFIVLPLCFYCWEKIVNHNKLGFSALSLLILDIAITSLVRSRKFSDITSRAMADLFQSLDDALIIIGQDKTLKLYNDKSKEILPFLGKMSLEEDFRNSRFKSLFAPAFGLKDKFPVGIEIKERLYIPKIKIFYDKDGYEDGYILSLSDVTDVRTHERKLNRMVEQRTQQIYDMQDRMMLGFASLAEGRDGGTGKHLRRTSSYVLMLAQTMKDKGLYPDIINDRWIETLQKVAPLHDLGKISIPDAILKKPASLTPEERTIIQNHTILGYNLIQVKLKDCFEDNLKFQMASEVARYHHEWWNGTGYPDKIAGDKIPLSARIMAVADVFDALVTERPYKPAFPFEEAIDMISKEAGTHFDKDVVDALIENKAIIQQISENLKDDI